MSDDEPPMERVNIRREVAHGVFLQSSLLGNVCYFYILNALGTKNAIIWGFCKD